MCSTCKSVEAYDFLCSHVIMTYVYVPLQVSIEGISSQFDTYSQAQSQKSHDVRLGTGESCACLVSAEKERILIDKVAKEELSSADGEEVKSTVQYSSRTRNNDLPQQPTRRHSVPVSKGVGAIDSKKSKVSTIVRDETNHTQRLGRNESDVVYDDLVDRNGEDREEEKDPLGCSSFTESQMEIVEGLTGLRSIVEEPREEKEEPSLPYTVPKNQKQIIQMNSKVASGKTSSMKDFTKSQRQKGQTKPKTDISVTSNMSSVRVNQSSAPSNSNTKRKADCCGKRIVALSGFEVS